MFPLPHRRAALTPSGVEPMKFPFAATCCAIALWSVQPAASEPSYFDLLKIKRACDADIQTLCKGVAVGEGRILACLSKQADKVSAGCKAAAEPYRDKAAQLSTTAPE